MNKDSITLNLLYNEWIILKEKEVSASTYAKTLYTWSTYFSNSDIINIPIPDITRQQLKSFCMETVTNYDLTRHYFNSHIKPIFNSLYEYAVDLEIIPFNKFRTIKFKSRQFRPSSNKYGLEDVFTSEEMQGVIRAALLDSLDSNNSIPLAIPFLFYTGLRVGELCALRWSDLDGNILNINRMIVEDTAFVDGHLKRVGYKVVCHLKTEAGYRRVILPDVCVQLLDTVKQINLANDHIVEPDNWIFPRKNRYTNGGNYYPNPRCFDSRIRKYCRNTNMNYIKSCHDIRRTYISNCIDAGMDPDSIRSLVGHEDINMTFEYIRNRYDDDNLLHQLNNIFGGC